MEGEAGRQGGGGRRKAIEAALLELFRKESTASAEEDKKKKNPAGGRKKGPQGGGGVGFDKRQLLEKLNAGSSGAAVGQEEEEEEVNVEEDDEGQARVRVDERALGAALKGLVSRGVLRVHQGRWCLAPQAPTPSPDGGGHEDDDGHPADEEEEPSAASARERKKNKKWEKLPHGVSEVVPGFLYLGSARDAEDEAQLQALGITHVLNVAKEWPKPRHCKYLDSLTAYKRVPLEDRLSESLFPIVEDEALAFIERARADHPASRVLVHCVLGKSRSVSAVVAYLVRHRGMTLRQAYLHVLEQRKAVVVVRPNRSFVAQLMAWEVTATATATTESTLSWDDIDTGFADFQAWLAEASLKTPLSGSRSKKAAFDKELQGAASSEASTHLWWTFGDKPEYCIPADREAELLSEYAKAYLRGEELCLIERRTSPRYRLYFDLDIKCSFTDDHQPRPSLSDVLHLFLPFFTRVFSDFFGADPSESADDQRPPDGVTLSVNWKYGFHLVWDLATTAPRHRAFLKALVKHLEPQWETAEEAEIPDYIRKVNQLSELIDSAIFTSTDTLRLLYSSKTLACKACKTKQPSGPRKGGKQKATPLAKAKAKGGKDCGECGGTGKREGRVYEWLGFFDARSGLHDAARTAELQAPTGVGGPDAVKLARRRIEACSIRLAQG